MLYLLFGLAALSIMLTITGSILQSAAKKTLQRGTTLMNKGGRAIMDVSGLELATETKRLASNFKRKTANTLGLSHSEATSTDDVDGAIEGRSHAEDEGKSNKMNNTIAEDEEINEDRTDIEGIDGVVIVTGNTNGSEIENEDSTRRSHDKISERENCEENSNESGAKESIVISFSNQNTEDRRMPIADAMGK